MALTYPFDVSTPGGSDDPTQGDDRIRELKNAIVERESQDHYWPASGDTYDDDDCGLHKKATLLVQSSVTAKADAGIIYSKDVSSKAELHYMDEDSNEVQLTSGGSINTSSELVTGDIILSSVSTAHSGWTDVTATYANKYIRIGTTGLATGGSATLSGSSGSYTLTISDIPSHTHTVTCSDTSGGGSTVPQKVANQAQNSSFTTNASGGGGGHSHDLTSVACTPLYVDLRMFKKD